MFYNLNDIFNSQKYNNSLYNISKIKSDASKRKYIRYINKNNNFYDNLILMDAREDNDKIDHFCYISNLLNNISVKAPKIFNIDNSKRFLLLEDVGYFSLKDILLHIKNNFNDDIYQNIASKLYFNIIDLILKIENINIYNIDKTLIANYKNSILLQEVNLFFQFYLKYKNISYNNSDFIYFQNIFLTLFKKIKTLPTLILRDIHSENIILSVKNSKNNHNIKYIIDNLVNSDFDNINISLIDFQDALIGDKSYDLTSLIDDIRYINNDKFKHKILDYYLKNNQSSNYDLLNNYKIFNLQRNIKIIGIFSRLFIIDNKKYYIKFIDQLILLVNIILQDSFFNEFDSNFLKSYLK